MDRTLQAKPDVAGPDLFSDEFTAAVVAAVARARERDLKAGIPIFYQGEASDEYVMEHPDGRKFQIRFIPGAPRDRHYEIVREIPASAS